MNTVRIGTLLAAVMAMAPCARAQVKPNIVWLVSEDHGPHMGCYGDTYATTPNVDRLASTSLRYRRCWSNAPVCAPARTTLILGLYATSSGGEHMRSMVPMPRGLQMYPQLLREAGYYCTNNAKEDYNVAKPGKVWDESSKNAHWKNRPEDKPFFAVFNSEKSHESRMRARPHKPIHDPARVRIPAYHPDTPEVRRDWAQYYDVVSAADADAGDRLQELAAAGLLEDTIVFYFADHGSGMPRNKRWPYNSGLHVPLVVHIPDRFRELRPDDYQPGGVSDRLVSFVDFAPTLLSLAGVKPPDWMQGHAFLGKFIAPPQPHLYGFRGRMDERYDLVRSVTDGRYVYVRQYMPRLIYGQHVEYMFQTPTTVVWKQLHDAGRLTAEQDHFWNRKPSEELYDLQSDPDEVHNLAYRQGYQEIRSRLRNAQLMHSVAICDLGFLTEGERFERAHGDSQYDFGHDASRYPIKKILNAAEQATMPEADDEYAIKSLITDSDSAVRYWCIQGIQLRGKEAVKIADRELRAALTDTSPYVRIAAAQTLLEQGDAATVKSAMMELVARADWSKNNVFVAIAALDVLDAQPDQAARFADQIRLLPVKGPAPDPRYSDYVPRLLEHLNAALK